MKRIYLIIGLILILIGLYLAGLNLYLYFFIGKYDTLTCFESIILLLIGWLGMFDMLD